VGYLNAALEDGDPALVAAVVGDIARARGMTGVARQSGSGRESLYKALSPRGNPELATILRVLKALGYRLTAVPILSSARQPRRKGKKAAPRAQRVGG
jgi:probable addiction module antidote protein